MNYDMLLTGPHTAAPLTVLAALAVVALCMIIDGICSVAQRIREGPERRRKEQIEFMRRVMRDLADDGKR